MVDGVVMCEKDYAELVATWPCVGCGKEIPTGDRTDIYSFPSLVSLITYVIGSLVIWIHLNYKYCVLEYCIGIEYCVYGVSYWAQVDIAVA